MSLNKLPQSALTLEKQCLRLQDAYLKFKHMNLHFSPSHFQQMVSSSLTLEDLKTACLIEEVQLNLDTILKQPSRDGS